MDYSKPLIHIGITRYVESQNETCCQQALPLTEREGGSVYALAILRPLTMHGFA